MSTIHPQRDTASGSVCEKQIGQLTAVLMHVNTYILIAVNRIKQLDLEARCRHQLEPTKNGYGAAVSHICVNHNSMMASWLEKPRPRGMHALNRCTDTRTYAQKDKKSRKHHAIKAHRMGGRHITTENRAKTDVVMVHSEVGKN